MDEHSPTGDPLSEGGFETLCAHYGEHRLAHGGAAAPPLYHSSTFVFPDAEAFERRLLPQSPHFDCTRRGNPTVAILESKLARLERGEWPRCFASGMGAISSAIKACVSGATYFDRDPSGPLWLIRLHVGLESTEDLVRDVRQALEE